MFLIRYVVTSFRSLANTLKLRKEKGWKITIYFFLLTLVMSFPLNYAIVRENGWNLNFIRISLVEHIPLWYPLELPVDCELGPQGFTCDTTTVPFTLEANGFSIVFGGTLSDVAASGDSLILGEDKIYYVDDQGATLETDYRGFTRVITFHELRANSSESTIDEFASSIEDSFGAYLIIYSVITNVWVSLLLNLIYVFMFALLIMIFKIGYQTFMNYREAVKLSVVAMTIPAIVSVVVGFLSPEAFTFSSMIMAFGVPLMMIILIKIPGKKEFLSKI